MALTPFQLLFDDADSAQQAVALPAALQAVYGGDWQLPPSLYVYSNFALSRDGRISYNQAGHMGGGDISGFCQHDQWLMGLLRARADAVIMGDTTLRVEPEHLWTSDYIFPEEAAQWAALRQQEQRQPYPLAVFLSLTGKIDPSVKVLQHPEMRVLIATTSAGLAAAQGLQDCPAQPRSVALGEEQVDIPALLTLLEQEYGVRSLLCEGGPGAYASMLAAQCIHEEFLTLCPRIVGSAAASPRPGLLEGAAFDAVNPPESHPVSLRRAGHHLFLRSRLHYPPR